MTSVSSDNAKPGDTIQAELISPVAIDGRVALPAGAKVQGRVVHAEALGWGVKKGRAGLSLQFDELVCEQTGESIRVPMALEKVDTAREDVAADGRIHGISPAMSVSSALAAYAWRLVMLEPTIGMAVWGVKFALAPAPDPEIRLPVGAEMLLRTTERAEFPIASQSSTPAVMEDGEHRLLRLGLEGGPLRIQRKSGEDADRINVVIAGEEEAIQRAFAAAGWVKGEKRTPVSLAKTYFHIVQRKGYPTGPMTPMTFVGKEPSFTFQKALNTFSRRHHLRIWRTSITSNDQPVWFVAATEDIDVGFDGGGWTHQIDEEIDNERAKVVSDLMYTGCVAATALIHSPRLETPELRTDGAVAGIRLNSCDAPRLMAKAERKPRGNGFARFAKAMCKEAVRSNLSSIAMTTAHFPSKAFAAKPEDKGHRGLWAKQQASVWERKVASE